MKHDRMRPKNYVNLFYTHRNDYICKIKIKHFYAKACKQKPLTDALIIVFSMPTLCHTNKKCCEVHVIDIINYNK